MIYTSREVYEYISKQTKDPIVEQKTCAISGTQFPIYQSDLDFYTKISPTFAGEKFQIPTPTLCPEERQRRRLSFRNERKLYKRTCNYSGKEIISIYSPDKPYKVYDQKIRWSDLRDPMDYAMDFDFTKSFTEQFEVFSYSVPRMSLINEYKSLENSEYINNSMTCKNCYMLAGGTESENCMYATTSISNTRCLDTHKVYNSAFCYESLYCYRCFKVDHSIRCEDCKESSYLKDCKNCEFCFGCEDLHNKKYCYRNIQYTQEEYISIRKVPGFYENQIKTSSNNLNSIQSFGNLITNSNKAFGYDILGGDEVKYGLSLFNVHSSMDVSMRGDDLHYGYEVKEVGIGARKVFFSFSCRDGIEDIYYSQFCKTGRNLFGCIGLRNKQYCIFNKQYTKEDYEIMVGKIIRHMMSTGERGEFFHPSLSPFGYNETVAQEYYPLECDGINLNSIEQTSPSARSAPGHLSLSGETKQGENNVANTTGSVPPDKEGGRGLWPRTGGLQLYGYHRSTYSSDPKIPEGVKTIDCRQPEWAEDSEQWKQLNQMIVGTHGNASVINQLSGDNANIQPNYDICKQIILCEISGRPFMLQKAEIDFYRKHHIPLPRKHPDIRHEERMKLRPWRTLYLRNCDCCSKEMLSVYDKQVGKLGEVREVGNDKELNLPNSLTSPTQIVYCESCYTKEIYG